ncbi:MAG TPA: OmpA family protein [Candidatus Cloacimonas sp.]|nr:OmpA family protein [Candidatus Cloacimonas sp.]
MNAKSVLLILLIGLGLGIAHAAYISPGWNYGYELGIARGDNQGSAENLAPMLRGHVQLQIFKFLYLRGGLGYVQLHASKDKYNTNSLVGDYRFIAKPFDRKWTPFVFLGSGAQLDMSEKILDFIPLYPFGVGVQTPIKPGMLMEITAAYNLTNSDDLDNISRNNGDELWLTGNKQDAFYSLSVGLSYYSAGPQERKPAPVPKAEPIIIPAPKPTPIQVTPPPPPPKEEPAQPDLKVLDSDSDGLTDYDEINLYKSNPNNADSDGDGLNDYVEVMRYKTNPLNPDTDGDGLRDGEEVNTHKTDPLKSDTDGDGLKDGEEVNQYKTNPLNPDTDGDGLKDGEEVNQYKTNPLNPDTDGDGLKDGEEVSQYKTNPLDKDTDKGSKEDGKEVAEKSDPLDPKDDVMVMTEGAKFTLEGILFDTAKATIKPASIPILEQAFSALQSNPTVKVRIVGHTDNVGSAASNLTLSRQRAESVMNWLINKGIAPERLSATGRGLTEPRATNDTAEGRQLNRRIDFEIVEQ